MSRERKPWEIPISYNDERFVEPSKETGETQEANRVVNELDGDDVDALIRRPDDQSERSYECVDMTPINYGNGPHEEVFGVDESEFDSPDDVPVPYDNGPTDEEFGVDDDDDTGE